MTIAEVTARTHVSRILNKLHLANRVQAALYALREDIVTPWRMMKDRGFVSGAERLRTPLSLIFEVVLNFTKNKAQSEKIEPCHHKIISPNSARLQPSYVF